MAAPSESPNHACVVGGFHVWPPVYPPPHPPRGTSWAVATTLTIWGWRMGEATSMASAVRVP